MQNKIIFTLIVVIVILGVGGVYLLLQPNTLQPENKTTDTFATSTSTTTGYLLEEDGSGEEDFSKEKTVATKDFIYIGKKNPGKEINIDIVSLKQGGFVVIYENTFEAYNPQSYIECYKNYNPYWHKIHSVAPKNEPKQRTPYE